MNHLPSPSVRCSESCFAWSFVIRLLPSRYSLNFCRDIDLHFLSEYLQLKLVGFQGRKQLQLGHITQYVKHPTYHEIELFSFLLISSSFSYARLAQVGLRNCWLHRLSWTTVLEAFRNIIVFNGDHVLYCLWSSFCCLLNLGLTSPFHQTERHIKIYFRMKMEKGWRKSILW